jgi:hypothetical protein
MYMCPIHNSLRDSYFRVQFQKLFVRKRCYVLFLTRVFIVQVTKLVQFTEHTTFF